MKRLYLLVMAAAVGGVLVACTTNSANQALPGFPATGAKPPHRTASTMLAASQCGGASNGPQVESWLATANGNVAPQTQITGSNTQLASTFLDFVDAHGILWVATGSGIVASYPSTATGNVAPYAEISGSNTTFSEVTGVYVDSSGNVYAADFANNAIDIFNAGTYSLNYSGNSNIVPSHVISGAATLLDNPEGIWLDSSGNIYVADTHGPYVTEYAHGVYGNVAPIQQIAGSNTTFGFLGGLTLDSNGNIWVADQERSTDASDAIDEFTNGSGTRNVAPTKVIQGSNSGLVGVGGSPESDIIGIAVDSQGYIYVADGDGGTSGYIRVFGSGASGNVAPAQVVTGSNTHLCSTFGVAVH